MTPRPRKKILVFLDYDMLVRHFVLGGAFAEIEKAHDVTYVFHDAGNAAKRGIYTDVSKLGLKSFVRFQLPRRRFGVWDLLYCPTVLNQRHGTPDYQARLDLFYVTRDPKWVRRYAFLSRPGIYWLYRRLFMAAVGVYRPLSDFIARERPDIVLHPTILQGYFINELVPICRRLGIPLVCLMNSWDNPSQKSAATGRPDKLIVWGEQTRQHAVELMGMPAEDVLMFGAAQFQVYRNPVTESDAELRRQFAVPSGVPILLYGGVSKSIYENKHLAALDSAINEGRMPKCHILYRPHPWRGPLMTGERSFFDHDFKYVTMDPHMEPYYRRATSGVDPGFDMADYDVTRRLLALVDAVLSPLSTILLEAVMNQKPVLVIMAADYGDRSAEKLFSAGHRLTHFADLRGPGVNFCFDPTDLPAACAQLLDQAHDSVIKAALRQLAEHFVVMDGPTYSERLLALVNEMTGAELCPSGDTVAANAA